MRILKEFREFAVKGNVIDLAVGVIIGAAFGKIVSSLVADIIMPPIGLVVGKVNFTDLKWVIGPPAAPGKPPVPLNYGNFLQVTFDFLIVAGAVFLLVQAVNRLKRDEPKAAAAPPPSAPASPKAEQPITAAGVPCVD